MCYGETTQLQETWEAKAYMKSRHRHLFTSEGYLFYIIVKIMTKFEVVVTFRYVWQNVCFLCHYSEFIVNYAQLLENFQFILFELCFEFLYGESL